MTAVGPERAETDEQLAEPMARLVSTIRAKYDAPTSTALIVLVGIVGIAGATALTLAVAFAPLFLVAATAEELRVHFANLSARPRLSVVIAVAALAVPVSVAFVSGWLCARRNGATADTDHPPTDP